MTTPACFARIARRIAACGTAALVFSGLATAAELPREVATALTRAHLPADALSVVVAPVDATPAQASIRHRGDAPMNPASVMKLLTTYAALDLLGPGRTWETRLFAAMPPQGERIAGDVFLRGDGDPQFTVDRLWHLLRDLRGRGITRIDGDLVLDRSAFAAHRHDPAAFDGQPQRPYNVGPDALLFNYATMHVTLLPDTDGVRTWAEPMPAGLRIVNRLRATNARDCGEWRPHLAAQLSNNVLTLSGPYPRACGERRWHIAGADNAALLHGAFSTLWHELGGQFNGKVRDGVVPPDAHLLASNDSPGVAEIVRDINKWSNNVMARQVFLALAQRDGATDADAETALRAWLAEQGLRFPELVIDNGAGLSRESRISADSLARLLAVAWRSPVMPEFMASLPIAGIDGTLRRKYRRNGAAGRAHLKTGSLEGVRAMAGYVLNDHGQRMIVVALVNHPRAAEAQVAFDALLGWVAHGGN